MVPERTCHAAPPVRPRPSPPPKKQWPADYSPSAEGGGSGSCSRMWKIRTMIVIFLLGWLFYFQYKSTLCFFGSSGSSSSMLNQHPAVQEAGGQEDVITAASLRAFYQDDDSSSVISNTNYRAATVEDYVLSHTKEMGYEEEMTNPTRCQIWTNHSFVHYETLQTYLDELQNYTDWVKNFSPVPWS
jgi:hypothetical protein